MEFTPAGGQSGSSDVTHGGATMIEHLVPAMVEICGPDGYFVND